MAQANDRLNLPHTHLRPPRNGPAWPHWGLLPSHATHSPKETTKAAREAFMARLEQEVDPDGTLDPEDRARRAKAARKAYFAQLAH